MKTKGATMSDGSFFVNSDGLDSSKEGFHDKANQIQDLAVRINDLMNPARVADAAGNDKNGRTFAEQHISAVAKIHDGISKWGQVVGDTTDAIGGMAKSFRKTDEVVTDAGDQLGKSFLKLNQDTDSAMTGGGGNGGGGDTPPGQLTPAKRFDAKVETSGGTPLQPAVLGVPADTTPREFTPATHFGAVEDTPRSVLTPATFTPTTRFEAPVPSVPAVDDSK
jgi:hypothetical protein